MLGLKFTLEILSRISIFEENQKQNAVYTGRGNY